MGREKREMKQESQFLSIKRALNASQSSSFSDGELLSILEIGTDPKKVRALRR